MGRMERPLEPGDGLCAAFAADLRELRRAAGALPYRKLAERAHFSATALSEAAAGRRLPTLDVTLAYVRVCEGDVGLWERRWRETAAALASGENADDGPDLAVGSGELAPQASPTGDGWAQPDVASDAVRKSPLRVLTRRPRIAAGMVAAAGAAVLLAAAGLGDGAPSPVPSRTRSATPAAASPSAVSYDAVDPKASGCAADGVTIATAPVADAAGALGVIELRFSPLCKAAWARYTPTAAGSQQVSVWAVRPATGTKTEFDATVDRLATWTDLLSTGKGCIVAAVTAGLAGRTATAATQCRTEAGS